MRRFSLAICVLTAAVVAAPAFATITPSGSYSPTSPAPSSWTTSTTAYIGYQGTGSISVTPTSTLDAGTCYIGGSGTSYSGVTGNLTLNGSGANYSSTTAASLVVGYYGTGQFYLYSGASASGGFGYIGGNATAATTTGKGTVIVDGGSTWTNNYSLAVGYRGTGSLTISNGSTVKSNNSYSYIGYYTGSSGTLQVLNGGGGGSTLDTNSAYIGGYGTQAGTGTVTVDGGSTWNITGSNPGLLYVGYNSTGTLNISNGGTVVNTTGTGTNGVTYVGSAAGSGTINFGPNGGTLKTTSLFASPSQLTGTGTVDASGLVTDANLVFNSSGSLSQTVPLGNVSVYLTLTSAGALGAGYASSGSLTIGNGVTVNSYGGYLGYKAGSTGTATVSGSATWNTGVGGITVGNAGTGSLYVNSGGTLASSNGNLALGTGSGSSGTLTIDGSNSAVASVNYCYLGDSGSGTSTGTVTITNGGAMSSGGVVQIGAYGGGTGTVTVDGSNSKWTSSGEFAIGDQGIGTLNITNGGTVNTASAYISYFGQYGGNGALKVDGSGSNLTDAGDFYAGYGGPATVRITNGGTVTNAGVCNIGWVNDVGGNSGVVSINGAGSKSDQHRQRHRPRHGHRHRQRLHQRRRNGDRAESFGQHCRIAAGNRRRPQQPAQCRRRRRRGEQQRHGASGLRGRPRGRHVYADLGADLGDLDRKRHRPGGRRNVEQRHQPVYRFQRHFLFECRPNHGFVVQYEHGATDADYRHQRQHDARRQLPGQQRHGDQFHRHERHQRPDADRQPSAVGRLGVFLGHRLHGRQPGVSVAHPRRRPLLCEQDGILVV